MAKLCQILLACVLVFNTFSWPSNTADAAKILGLFPHASESHFAVMRSITMELARRQHNVTIYNTHRLSEPVENLKEIVIEPEYPFWKEVQKHATGRGSIEKLSQLPAGDLQKSLAVVGAASIDYFLSSEPLKQLLDPSKDCDYDLILVDLFYSEALLALGYFFNRPTVGLVSSNFENYIQLTLGSLVPVACSPNNYETYSKDDGFWQRVTNIRDCVSARKQFVANNFVQQEKVIKKHFGHYKAAALPTVSDLQSSLAVLLINTHVPVGPPPQPMLQNTIAAGGLHIRPPRELPWHIKRFLDESRSGVVYMNFGNQLQCADIPRDKLEILFKILGKYKERVLWTCHDVQQMDNLPKNMMLQHLVSQTDILAHPHVKVFIMNGDLLSLQEGIVRHVPMIGVPIFRNEIKNMNLAVQLGVAVRLDYSNLTETSLTWALQTLLYDASFPITIRQVSLAFRDRPLGALETAMYWIDYVLRHNNGVQIRTIGVGMASSQLHLFDMFVLYFLIGLLFVGLSAGAYFVGLLLWKHQQTNKAFDKLN